jgi:hypothetical protein
METYIDGVFPGTPYGFVCFAPAWVEASRTSWASQTFVTDGITVTDAKGSPIPVAEMNGIVLDSLERRGSELPFLADHVFLAINQHGDGSYSLCLMDTKQFDVHDIHATLRIKGDRLKFKVVDAIDGAVLSVGDPVVSVVVPAGLFRILRVVPTGG